MTASGPFQGTESPTHIFHAQILVHSSGLEADIGPAGEGQIHNEG